MLDRLIERSGDRASGRPTPDLGTNARSIERMSVRLIDRSEDRAIERSSDRASDRSSDRAIERSSDRTLERSIKRVVRPTAHAFERRPPSSLKFAHLNTWNSLGFNATTLILLNVLLFRGAATAKLSGPATCSHSHRRSRRSQSQTLE